MLEPLQQQLASKLSEGASITSDKPSRWSTYGAPEPAAIVNVNSGEDVATTVKYCNANNLPFLVQSGGNGWAKFPHTKDLVLINLSQLNSVTVSSDKKSANIGGGAKIKETIDAADAAGVLIQTGNCNSVGTLGAILGGGYGNTMGMFGFGVDSILEMSVVTADGVMRTVSATENDDLFWAMRGAGPNFGIVIAATVKAYAMPKEERVAWGGALIFTDDKLEKVVEALQNLELSNRMVAFMYFSSAGPPSHTPMVVVTVWMFQGTPETGRAAFRTLFDLEPMVDTTSVLPYTEWNTGADPHCAHSERKPTFAAGLDRLDATTWRGVWDKFVEFQKRPGAHGSTILLEMYPMNDIRFAGEAWTSFPHRRVRFQAAVMAWYNDSSLDEEAEKFGRGVRQLWESSGGAGKNSSYINLCHSDESLEDVYGESLPHLRELKKVWDPKSRLNQWFNIS